MAVPFDHHGQVTPELLSAVDVLSALRTAPHRDAYETSRRAAQQLIDVLRSGRRPFKAAVRIPIYVPGEKSMTIFSPAKELFELLPSYDVMPGVCEANIFVGFGWNDVPWCGMETVVTHFGSEAEAVRLATELADQIWERRKDFRLQMETATVQEGIRRASALPGKLIYLSDSGDNTTAGAGGDLTFVLQEALEQGVEDIVVAGIFDRRFVEVAHQAGPGNTVSVEIGHHLSAEPKVRKVSATVISVGDRLDVSAYPNLTSSPAPWAVVSVQGVIATFHAARVGITGPGHMVAMGISPDEHRIYAAKVGYLHPDQMDVAKEHICLLSPGVAALEFTELPYHNIPRPAFPMDPDMDWRSADGVFVSKPVNGTTSIDQL